MVVEETIQSRNSSDRQNSPLALLSNRAGPSERSRAMPQGRQVALERRMVHGLTPNPLPNWRPEQTFVGVVKAERRIFFLRTAM